MTVVRLAALVPALLVLGLSPAIAEGAAPATCITIYYGTIEYCALAAGTASVTNRSFSVIDVQTLYGSTRLAVPSVRLPTLADVAADTAAPARCSSSGCQLPPGRGLVASDTVNHPLLKFSFNLERTIARNTALTLVGMLEEKFSSPGRTLATRAGECAVAIGNLADAPSDWASAIRRAVPTYSSCSGVVRALRTEPGGEERVGSRAVSWAKGIVRGAWIDEMFTLFPKVLRR